jgi:crotonobetainyl-CoA:carnitine CoA-transferase CaiB-like acyl-CoA transferase
VLNPPFRFSAARAAAQPFAAGLGEHTDPALAEAGYRPDEIAEFRRVGALG